jgi:hypothetical protein
VIRILLFCAVLGLISSTVYLILAIAAAGRFWMACRKQVEDGISFPPVTVLKPIYGLEPQLERNLAVEQRLGSYEILLLGAHGDR